MSVKIKPDFSKAYAYDSAKRAVKTFAQTLVALLLVGQTGLLDVDWPASLSAAGLATLISLLQSLGKIEVSDDDADPADPFSGVQEALVKPKVIELGKPRTTAQGGDQYGGVGGE